MVKGNRAVRLRPFEVKVSVKIYSARVISHRIHHRSVVHTFTRAYILQTESGVTTER